MDRIVEVTSWLEEATAHSARTLMFEIIQKIYGDSISNFYLIKQLKKKYERHQTLK